MIELKALYQEILKAIAEDDDEKAHSLEDRLREMALVLIELQPPDRDCSAIARFALSTSKLKFARWCA